MLSQPLQALEQESVTASSPSAPESVQSTTATKEEFTAKLTAEQTCRRIGNKLGSVSVRECLDLDLQAAGGVSTLGTPILVKEFPPLPSREPQARVLLIGGIHGDEYSSVSVVFKWLKTLNAHHSGLFHWIVSPLVNPDGLLDFRPSQRMNARGVDLNRNFPTTDWQQESTDYWIRRTGRDKRRYPGPGPLSEPESQWVAKVIEQFKPNVIISVHAPYNVLDFDGPPVAPPRKLGHLYLDLMGTYPGSLGRYAGIIEGIPVITIELTYAGIMPTDHQIRKIWVDMVRWLSRNAHDRKPDTQIPALRSPASR
ncbi:MAG: murein peptide amidase A [Magnetococcales bacterium]|nr:murein peptide amidase A [Magnetococcales bacterium]